MKALVCVGLMAILLLPLWQAVGWASDKGDKPHYQDIYLTRDRVCKRCIGRTVDDLHVELMNRDGERGIYEASEILGVDNHPIGRRLLYRSVHGVGLPGRVIVPQAFEGEKYLHY